MPDKFDFMVNGGFGGGGGGNFLSNLFQNKMFLQFLAAAGQDIISGSGGKNLGGAINQNISSQNYMKLLSQMLSGDIPEGGVIKMGPEGMDIKVPKMGVGQPTSTSTGATRVPSLAMPDLYGQAGGLSGNANPFVSSQPGFSASDLAGVSPEMISQALQFKQNQEALEQKRVSDILDAMYKGRMADIAERGVAVDEAGIPIRAQAAETDASIAARQWYDSLTKDERTAMQKEYEAAKLEGYKGNLEDWKVLAGDPETIKLYKASIADGSFKGGIWQFIKQRAQVGAININLSPAERALSSASVEPRVQLKDPALLTRVIDEKLNTIEYKMASVSEPEKAGQMRMKVARDTIESMITTGGGKITKAYLDPDGKTGTWVVKWPDGTEETIRHALR